MRFRKLKLGALGLALATAVSIGGAGAVGASNDRSNFSTSTSGGATAFTGDCLSDTPTQTCVITFVGAGTMMVGSTTYPVTFTETYTALFAIKLRNGCWPVYGPVTLTATVGTVSKFEAGTVCHVSNGLVYSGSGFFIITGGTGAFVGASGSGTWSFLDTTGAVVQTENGGIGFHHSDHEGE